MVNFNVSADDTSPLISYSPAGAWTNSPPNDSSAPLYYQGSWHASSFYGASATFQFNGTGIWFFGAKRPRYGPYNISIDGHSVSGNAQSRKPTFQQLLGGRSGLSNGPHTAVFTNTGSGSSIDIDSIVFETKIDCTESAEVSETMMDDTGPAITYLPTQGNWVFTNAQGYFNDTLHPTQTGGAQVQLAFNGDAVAIYGVVSPGLANYTVTTDGVTQSFQGSTNGLAGNGTLLYFTGNLTSGPHNLTLTANPAQSGRHKANTLMGINRVVVLNASNDTTRNVTQPSLVGLTQKLVGPHLASTGVGISSLTGANNTTQEYTQRHPRRLNAVVIGGGIAGSVVLLLLIILTILLFRRRRPQESSFKLYRKFSIRQPKTPKLPMQPRPMPSISLPNSFSDPSDLEKIAPYSVPLGPNKNPFTDDAQVELPWVPETCVTRDAYDGWSGDLQVQSKPRSTVSTRLTRPPMLKLPLG